MGGYRPRAGKAHDAAVEKHCGQVVAGYTACSLGQARWCQGCDQPRLAGSMRWTLDGLFQCVVCLGPGVGTPELWMDPWPDGGAANVPLIMSMPGGGLLVSGPGADKVNHIRLTGVNSWDN